MVRLDVRRHLVQDENQAIVVSLLRVTEWPGADTVCTKTSNLSVSQDAVVLCRG